jgi:hypothetical protein
MGSEQTPIARLQQGRFVILRHEVAESSLQQRGDHFDVMLETGGVLATWAFPSLPRVGKTVVGDRLKDHRLEYLNLEGPISGDRGSVARKLAGSYRVRKRMEWGVRIELTLHDQSAWLVEIRDLDDGKIRLTRLRPEPA